MKTKKLRATSTAVHQAAREYQFATVAQGLLSPSIIRLYMKQSEGKEATLRKLHS
jgi:hypothetical protein